MASQSITGILAKAHREQGLAIPFHRIVYANGTIWVSDEYRIKRLALYKKEGIVIEKVNQQIHGSAANKLNKSLKIKDFVDILYEF